MKVTPRRGWERFLSLLRRRKIEQDLDDEMAVHLAIATEENRRRGMDANEARRAALLEFGGVEQAKELHRETRGLPILESLLKDVRYALRQLTKTPGFTITAVLSLALGIAATTAMFSLVYAVLIHPYPYAGAGRMVNPRLKDLTPGAEQHRSIVADWFALSGPQFEQFRKAKAIEDVEGFDGDDEELTGEELPEDVGVTYLTSNAASFFGVRPLLGRQIMPYDAPQGGPSQAVTVLTYRFWQRRYNSDPSVIGRKVELDHKQYTIVGVMPARFTFGARDLFIPLEITNDPKRLFFPYIKLRPGVTHAQANAEFQSLLEQFAKETPGHFPKAFRVQVQELIGPVVDYWGRTLFVLFAAVSLLLVMGCANCSILLLARGTARQHELSVRAAMGASRSRIVQQLLTESIILALAGSTVGVVLAYKLAQLPLKWMPSAFPSEAAIEINLPVLLFGVGLAFLTGALFGLLPSLRLSRADIIRPIQSNTRRTSAPAGIKHAHQALIAGQIALTLVLVTASAAVTTGFLRLIHANLGFDPQNTLDVGIPIHRNTHLTWGERSTYFDQLQERVSSVPGVSAVAIATTGVPISGEISTNIEISGKPMSSEEHVHIGLVSNNYFSLLQIALKQGRIWDRGEQTRGRRVAVVNETMARQYWPNEDPTGKHVRIPLLKPSPPFLLAPPNPDDWFEINGVVGDVSNDGLLRPPKPAIYVPYTSVIPTFTQMLVRTQGDAHAFLRAVRAAIQRLNADQEISKDSRTIDEWIAEEPEWGRERVLSLLFGGFAVIALVMAATGLYSVVSYGVTQRTNEFGIRMAVGALPGEVLWLVLSSTALIVGTGLIAGGVLSLTFNQLLGHWLQGAVRNPAVVAWAAFLLLITSALACFIPARRASSIDPMAALRHE